MRLSLKVFVQKTISILLVFGWDCSFAQTNLILPTGIKAPAGVEQVFISDSLSYLAARSENEITVWEVRSEKMICQISNRELPALEDLEFLPGFTVDEHYIILITSNAVLYFDFKTKEIRYKLSPFQDTNNNPGKTEIESALFSADHKLLWLLFRNTIKQGYSKQLVAYDVSGRKLIRKITLSDVYPDIVPERISLADKDHLLIYQQSPSEDRNNSVNARIIDPNTGTVLRIINGLENFTPVEGEGMVFRSSPSGKKVMAMGLLMGNEEPIVKVWEIATGKVVTSIPAPVAYYGISDVQFISDQEIIIGTTVNVENYKHSHKTLFSYSIPLGKLNRVIEAHSGIARLTAQNGLVASAGTEDQSIKLWTSDTWTNIKKLESTVETPSGISMLNDREFVMVPYRQDRSLFYWDLSNPEHNQRIALPSVMPMEVLDCSFDQQQYLIRISPDSGSSGNIAIWNLVKRRVSVEFTPPPKDPAGNLAFCEKAYFNSAGDQVAIIYWYLPNTEKEAASPKRPIKYMGIWGMDGKHKKSFAIGTIDNSLLGGMFTLSGKRLITISVSSDSDLSYQVVVYDLLTGREFKKFSLASLDDPLTLNEVSVFLQGERPEAVLKPEPAFAKKFINKQVGSQVYLTQDNTVMVIGEDIDGPLSIQTLLSYSGTGKRLVEMDPDKKSLIKTYQNKPEGVNILAVKPLGNKFILTSSTDNTMIVQDWKTGKEIATLLTFTGQDWMIITPDNYYFGTPRATQSMGFKFKNQAFSFDQFDLIFNRPDTVLTRIGLSSPELIEIYHKAYIKRLEKMKFKPSQLKGNLQQPTIMLGKSLLPPSVKQPEFSFEVIMTDSQYELDRLHLFVNDVPVYAAAGAPVQGKPGMQIQQSLSVNLSAGRNKIEVSVQNKNGVESTKELIEIFYDAPVKKPNLFLIAIGVSEYADVLKTLKYAAKDAQDFAALFTTEKGMYDKIEYIPLLNKDATKERINSLRNVLSKSQVDDHVYIFLAGHGIKDPFTDNWYFATQDIDFDHPAQKGVAFESLEALLEDIPARKKLLLLDACFSGEFDQDQNPSQVKQASKVSIVFRGIANAQLAGRKQDAKSNSAFEVMKIIFTDLRRGTGTTIISAASGNSYAYEDSKIQNGLFTYSLREALYQRKADKNKDGFVQVSELRDFVIENVGTLSAGQQKPTNRQENLALDFVVW